jgi:hypothetical protein
MHDYSLLIISQEYKFINRVEEVSQQELFHCLFKLFTAGG